MQGGRDCGDGAGGAEGLRLLPALRTKEDAERQETYAPVASTERTVLRSGHGRVHRVATRFWF